ncbi:hypothetical protein QYF36_011725 [Acer negundo]|nr:hypothetical protein QYF36_011725 [Acer negundo]
MDDFVINKDRSVAELEAVMPNTKIDGLDLKPIFVFGSNDESTVGDGLNFLAAKVIDRGPSENSLKPNNHVLKDAGETGGSNRSKLVEINRGPTVSNAKERKGSGNSATWAEDEDSRKMVCESWGGRVAGSNMCQVIDSVKACVRRLASWNNLKRMSLRNDIDRKKTELLAASSDPRLGSWKNIRHVENQLDGFL